MEEGNTQEDVDLKEEEEYTMIDVKPKHINPQVYIYKDANNRIIGVVEAETGQDLHFLEVSSNPEDDLEPDPGSHQYE